jgi:hypothetical protein
LGLEDGLVDDLSSVGTRIKHPDIENDLQKIVAWNEEEEDSEQLIESSEETEDNPVGQPHLALTF